MSSIGVKPVVTLAEIEQMSTPFPVGLTDQHEGSLLRGFTVAAAVGAGFWVAVIYAVLG